MPAARRTPPGRKIDSTNNIPRILDTTVPPGSLRGALTPPCSKSYAQRALAAALLAEGGSELHGIDFCDDTLSALRCIETLGARVVRSGPALRIEGGLRPRGGRLFTGESGLATRLFTPIASLWHEPVRIEGEGTLLARPMGALLEPLRTLGVAVCDRGGRLPLEVCGPMRGGAVTVDGSLSSQFVTGLLLALPLAAGETTVRVTDPVSTPYIDMTLDTAARFGVEICRNGYEEFFVEGMQRYAPATMEIEGDWSAAAMLLVAGATAGEVCVRNIRTLSKQADTAVIRALERAGAGLVCEAGSVTAARRPLRAFEFDATHCPDLFPALAALAAAADGTSLLRGVRRLRHKESDRAEAIRSEYGRLGIEVVIDDDTMAVRGGAVRGGRVSAHGDHRIAMSLAVAALRAGGEVVIEGAECVSKSYPSFFEDLQRLRV